MSKSSFSFITLRLTFVNLRYECLWKAKNAWNFTYKLFLSSLILNIDLRSNIGADEMLYNETDLENSMSKIDTINFHQEIEIEGIKFWCYHAGHVLGAAMFMIEIAGVRILYTGDFSRVEDRHLMAAELPTIKPDVLIIGNQN